jgi:hypothetical protein
MCRIEIFILDNQVLIAATTKEGAVDGWGPTAL